MVHSNCVELIKNSFFSFSESLISLQIHSLTIQLNTEIIRMSLNRPSNKTDANLLALGARSLSLPGGFNQQRNRQFRSAQRRHSFSAILMASSDRTRSDWPLDGFLPRRTLSGRRSLVASLSRSAAPEIGDIEGCIIRDDRPGSVLKLVRGTLSWPGFEFGSSPPSRLTHSFHFLQFSSLFRNGSFHIIHLEI